MTCDPNTTPRATGPGWELRLGDWRTALADVDMVDVLLTDAPYSPRVHEGQRTGSQTRKSTLDYGAISPEYCAEFAASWAPRTSHWALVFSDHKGSAWWEDAWENVGWYVFAPVIWHRTNPTPRIAGDGPTSEVDYITVARQRRSLPKLRRGSRRGYYPTQNLPGSCLVPGGKQIDPMRSIIRDYTLHGDLVCDPHAGGATTQLAAAMEGRAAIGAELMLEHFDIARKRLERGFTAPMFAESAGTVAVQQSLLGGDDE